MRKIDIYVSTSLDGYIPDNKNTSFFYNNKFGFDKIFEKFFKNLDIIIMDRATYDNIVNENTPNNWPCTGKITYVITNDYQEDDLEDIIFYKDNVLELLNKLKEENGRDIWIEGGSDLIHQIIDANLVDNYYISIVPLILGSGDQLFDDKSDRKISLNLIKTHSHDGIITAHYAKE